MSLNKIKEINNSLKLDERASVDRILMKMERTKLCWYCKGNKKDSSYRHDEPFNVGEKIKKVLHAKRPDRILTRELFESSNLPEMDIRQRIVANCYYKMSDTKNQRGVLQKLRRRNAKRDRMNL